MNCSHVTVQRHGGLSPEMQTIPKRTQHTTVPPFFFSPPRKYGEALYIGLSFTQKVRRSTLYWTFFHPESTEKHSILDFLFTQKVRRGTLYWTFFHPESTEKHSILDFLFTQKARSGTLYWTFFSPRKHGAALYIGLSFHPESTERHSILDFLFTQKARSGTLYQISRLISSFSFFQSWFSIEFYSYRQCYVDLEDNFVFVNC